LSGLIRDHLIMEFAVAQQFHSSPWPSRAGDNRVTGSPNERNVEGRLDPLTAARRAWLNGKYGCHRRTNRAFIFNA